MALTEASLFEYLREQLGVDTAEVTPETPLFSAGLVDSFSLVSLITFIEKQEKIRVSPMEVALDNLDSVEKILAFVERKKSGA